MHWTLWFVIALAASLPLYAVLRPTPEGMNTALAFAGFYVVVVFPISWFVFGEDHCRFDFETDFLGRGTGRVVTVCESWGEQLLGFNISTNALAWLVSGVYLVVYIGILLAHGRAPSAQNEP